MIRFSCPKCQKVLQAAAEQAGIRVSCPRCKFQVQVPSAAPIAEVASPPATTPAPEASTPVSWYLTRDGKRHGPYTAAQLKQHADSGQLLASDLLWKEGLQGWKSVSEFREFLPMAPREQAKATTPGQPPAPAPPISTARAPHPSISPVNQWVEKAKEKAKKVPLWGWLVGIPLGGLFLCCGGCVMMTGLVGLGHKAQQEAGAKKVAESKDAIKVSAATLFQAYKNNEVKAKEDYGGKVVEVSGTVEAVKERYIELAENDSRFVLGLVHVYPDDDSKQKMGSLNKGQYITIRGICKGKSFASVDVENAILLAK